MPKISLYDAVLRFTMTDTERPEPAETDTDP